MAKKGIMTINLVTGLLVPWLAFPGIHPLVRLVAVPIAARGFVFVQQNRRMLA